MSDENGKRVLQVAALPGYAVEIGRALWMLEDTRRRTKDHLKDLAPSVIDWRASEADNSIGTLLYHMAAIELDWLYAEVLEQAVPTELMALFPHDVREQHGQLTPVEEGPLETYVARLDTTRTTLLAAFRPLTLEDFQRLRQLEAYDVSPEWVLHHLMQHEAEHRGQIIEIRRLAERALA
ncbi:hypothetical protein BH10CHL1_BH10CHL1_25150 [soil metagenome]